MIVPDASVMVNALVEEGPPGDRAREALAGDARWAAPSHLHLEVTSALRRRVLISGLSPDAASQMLATVALSQIRLFEPRRLVARVWELRDNLTPYDAAYVAAAEAAQCRLVTADRKLAMAPGIRCDVTVL